MARKKNKVLVFLGLLLLLSIVLLIVSVFIEKRFTEKSEALKGEKVIECKKSGCSHQFCISVNKEDIVSTCEWREEYKCYQNAICEIQNNGKCGFTPSEELSNCLNKSGGSDIKPR